jgi:hypothetical protein
MTDYTYKVLLIYPASEIAGVNAFVQEFLDPTGAGWVVNCPATVTGELPLTHGWTSFAATKEQAMVWLDRFANRLGGEAPANFTDLPRNIQRQWMQGAQGALWGASGVYFQAVFNDEGEAPDSEAALAYCGLTRVPVEEP